MPIICQTPHKVRDTAGTISECPEGHIPGAGQVTCQSNVTVDGSWARNSSRCCMESLSGVMLDGVGALYRDSLPQGVH